MWRCDVGACADRSTLHRPAHATAKKRYQSGEVSSSELFVSRLAASVRVHDVNLGAEEAAAVAGERDLRTERDADDALRALLHPLV